MSIEQTARPTAGISVTVTDFQPIGQGNGCSHARFKVTKGQDVEIVHERGVDVILVKGKMKLEFHLDNDASGSPMYLPIGIAFQQLVRDETGAGVKTRDGSCANDPLGFATFPKRGISVHERAALLTVHDDNPEPAVFAFELVIQRVDGTLSRIDPKIRNVANLPN